MKEIIRSIYRSLPFKKSFFVLLKQFWTPSESVYRHLHFKDVFTVKVGDRAQFFINHHGYQIENEIFWKGLTGGWEKTSMRVWTTLCKASDVILDIGANTGVYSLVAKAVHPGANVHAFEPVHRVFEKLVANTRLNHFDISCHEVAVSNVDGEATIYDTQEEHILSVTVNKDMSQPGTNVVAVKVETIRLSTLIEQEAFKKIDLIKIDVETHEPEVLEGLEPFLTRFTPTLLIEVLTDEVAEKLEKIVSGKNYLYFNINEEKGIRQTNVISKSDHYNYLVCQPDIAMMLDLVPEPKSP